MASEEVERRVAEVFEAGDREELVRAYARWAERYDEDMLGLEMRGPEIVAAMTARYVRDRASPILDAGAGTGRIGELLAILGYSNLAALDLSDAMLALAQERDVYRALHQGALGLRSQTMPSARSSRLECSPRVMRRRAALTSWCE